MRSAVAMLAQSSAWHGHRDMLHDRERNSAYDRAISAAVRDISSSNRTAVDVGTGSGLLAMFAARAGASVTAFETVPALAHLARDVVRENGLADAIAVTGAHSTEAPPPAKRAQLLVHELLDTGLVGEGLLAGVRHAHEALLADGAVSVPAALELIAQPISSAFLAASARLGDGIASVLLPPMSVRECAGAPGYAELLSLIHI